METVQVRKSINEKIGDILFGENRKYVGLEGFAVGAVLAGSIVNPIAVFVGVPVGLAAHLFYGKSTTGNRENLDNPNHGDIKVKQTLSEVINNKLYGEKGIYSLATGFAVGAVIGGGILGAPVTFPGAVATGLGGLAGGLANCLMNYRMLKGGTEQA